MARWLENIKRYLWENAAVYAAGAVLLLLGMAVGVGFFRHAETGKEIFCRFSVSAVGAMIQGEAQGTTLFFFIWLSVLKMLGLFFLFGLSFLGMPVCGLFVAAHGFRLGYTICVLLNGFGFRAVGIAMVLTALFLVLSGGGYLTCCVVNLRALALKRHRMPVRGLSRTEAGRMQVYGAACAAAAVFSAAAAAVLEPFGAFLQGLF